MTHARTYDRLLIGMTSVLLFVGILMLYSSTSVVTPAQAKLNYSEFAYVKKQLFTMLLGFIAMGFASRLDLDALRRWAGPLLGVSAVLLVLVFVPGVGVKAGGATRWIRLWPTTFQPSELVKLAMVVFLAGRLSDPARRPEDFWSFSSAVFVMLAFQGVFLMQPDFGAAMSLGLLTVSMLYLAGTPMRHLLGLGVLALPAIAVLIREPYRWKRIIAFLDPWAYSDTIGFHLVQSFLAFGRGGLGGVGIGKGMQKLDYLPEVHTDFIFSLLGEEMGFLAAAAVVALYAVMFRQGMAIAGRAKDPFAYHLACGLSLMIGFQALVNFGVVTGMLPTKGLPLPFLSYGGSALVINMTAIGLLLNLSVAREPKGGGRDFMADALRAKKARRAVYGTRG